MARKKPPNPSAVPVEAPATRASDPNPGSAETPGIAPAQPASMTFKGEYTPATTAHHTDPTPDIFTRLGFPPRRIKGAFNPEFLSYGYEKLLELTFINIVDGEKVPFNAKSVEDFLNSLAKINHLDPKKVQDRRKPEQIIEDVFVKLAEDTAAIWELRDEELALVEKTMDDADSGGLDFLDEKIRSAANPKIWADRFRTVRRLRERARTPSSSSQTKALLPKRGRKHPELKDSDEAICAAACQAAWPLRLMVYVGRSNNAKLANGPPKASVYQIAPHHVKMACDVWQAKHKVAFGPPKFNPKGDNWFWPGEIAYRGCILVCPMGHGKTDFGRFIIDSFIVENPHHQCLLNHAVAEKAQENLAYLSSLYKTDSPIGRRHHALFPLELDQCNTKQFRLKLPNRLKSATASAAGVDTAVLGANASIQWWDDPVNQTEATQEADRKRTFETLNGRWMSRMRGTGDWFLLVTATLWHNADAISRYIQRAKQSRFRVSKQACGGPKTTPQFHALWPSMIPSSELRTIYQTMQSPALYAAAYMSNPIAEEKRIVRKLRLYDPVLLENGEPTEHARFLDSSTKFLSLDPAATRGERSDSAGLIYAGFGSVNIKKLLDGRMLESTENRLRLFEAQSVPSTQSELVQYTVDLSRTRHIDYVLVECRSGYVATAEMFENYHGIDVIRIDPRNKNKEERLRAAAPAIEDANADLGLRAVVEFPGVRTGRRFDNGEWELALDPRFKQLAEEILDFGVCATDDQVDGLDQLVIYLAPDLGIGTGGIVNRQIAKSQPIKGDPRLLAMIAQYENGPPKVHRHNADLDQWMGDNWSLPRRELPGDLA